MSLGHRFYVSLLVPQSKVGGARQELIFILVQKPASLCWIKWHLSFVTNIVIFLFLLKPGSSQRKQMTFVLRGTIFSDSGLHRLEGIWSFHRKVSPVSQSFWPLFPFLKGSWRESVSHRWAFIYLALIWEKKTPIFPFYKLWTRLKFLNISMPQCSHWHNRDMEWNNG